MSLFARLSELPNGHADERNDFDKRFNHTYLINYEKKEKPEVLLNRGLDGYYVHFRRKSGETYVVDGRKDFPIEPFMPKTGYYNSNLNLFYIYKTPARQWKRSICSSIYRINTELTIHKDNWYDLIEGILNKQYVHIDYINNPLFSKYAITPNFAVKPDLNLYYKEHVIASINFQSKEIKLMEQELKQELLDFFKHHGIYKWKLNLTPQE